VRAFTAAMWRAMPDMRFEEPFGLFHAEEGERAAAPWRMTATFSGPMEPPGFAPTGDRIEVEGVDVFELRDGKVARLWTHYDAMEIARRLGVLPPRGSAAERAGAKLQGLMAARRRRRN
jgi:predicted ester cyclase